MKTIFSLGLEMNVDLRARYMRAKVKSTLKRTTNPISASTPIQNQFLSGNMSKFLSTATPKLVVPSEACSTSQFK